MKTELVYVTPKQAREWLKKNTDNRRLRPTVVDGLRQAYDRGEWKLTHQGVAFSKAGRLIDGQHRLTFISQLDESDSVPLLVTIGADDDTFAVIDQGARRTLSDVAGVSIGLAAIGTFFARVVAVSRAGLTAAYTQPFIEWVQPEYEELLTFCPTSARLWSSAAVRAAAIYQIKRGMDEDKVKVTYRALVLADIDSMSQAARALMSQHMSGKIMSARGLDLFCRAARAFDTKAKGGGSRIIIRDQAQQIADLRAFIGTQIDLAPQKKNGPHVGGPKDAKQWTHSKAA